MTTVTELSAAVETAVTKRGRKSIFEKRDALVSALRAIHKGETETRKVPSRFIQRQMAARGLVEFTPVRTGARGRPAHTVSLTVEGVRELARL